MSTTVSEKKSTVSAPLIEAIEGAWNAICQRHHDLPRAVIVVGSGTAGRVRGELKLGHFAALRWTQGATELAEVFVAGEGLQRGGASVLAILLHEAAHGLAQIRGVAEVSRGGRYHNRRYKALSEEVGLTVSRTGTIGWSMTELPEATARRYQREIERLGSALTLYRRAEVQGVTRRPGNLSVARCACPRRIRVAASTLGQGPIVCGICGSNFELGVVASSDGERGKVECLPPMSL